MTISSTLTLFHPATPKILLCLGFVPTVHLPPLPCKYGFFLKFLHLYPPIPVNSLSWSVLAKLSFPFPSVQQRVSNLYLPLRSLFWATTHIHPYVYYTSFISKSIDPQLNSFFLPLFHTYSFKALWCGPPSTYYVEPETEQSTRTSLCFPPPHSIAHPVLLIYPPFIPLNQPSPSLSAAAASAQVLMASHPLHPTAS